VRVGDDPERVVLTYQWTPYNSEPRQVECALWIERTPCNYGGTRPWFRCPSCGRRCAVVYYGAPGGRYACRRCVRVTYLSQCDDLMGRLWRKQRKVERKLAGAGGQWNGWQRPRGMHEKTFNRLVEMLDQIEKDKAANFSAQMLPLLARLGVNLSD
jgi:hypothetical protein